MANATKFSYLLGLESGPLLELHLHKLSIVGVVVSCLLSWFMRKKSLWPFPISVTDAHQCPKRMAGSASRAAMVSKTKHL